MGEVAIAERRGFRSGTRLGRFSLGPLLARGGMGELYLARADGVERFSKLLAVKVLLPQLTDDAEFVQMFLHEARITARLDHPNIAAVTELSEVSGEYFIAIEYVHGRDLRSVLRASADATALPLDCALQIVTRVCAGLHFAHTFVDTGGSSLDIVHRDVTPSNVVVRYDGEVKIVDFGIAKASTGTKLTRTGTMKGKPSYMSPEQCLEQALDRRSDIWGLGVLLYEATTGRKLFFGDNDFAIMGRVIRGEFPRPTEIAADYPAELEDIVMRALRTEPEERFESAAELQRALEDFAAEAGMVLSAARVAGHMNALFGTPAIPEVTAVTKPIARKTWRAVAAVGALGAAVALGAWGWSGGPSPPQDTARAPVPSPPEATPAAAVPPVPIVVPAAPEPRPEPVAAEAPPAARAKKKSRRKTRRKDAPKGELDLDALVPGKRREP